MGAQCRSWQDARWRKAPGQDEQSGEEAKPEPRAARTDIEQEAESENHERILPEETDKGAMVAAMANLRSMMERRLRDWEHEGSQREDR